MRTAAGVSRGRCRAAAGALLGAGLLATLGHVAGANVAAADTPARAPIVVVGVAGLTWPDVTPTAAPAIWGLLEGAAAAGAVTVYTGGAPVCGIGGWLALSSGRAIDAPHVGDICGALPAIAGDTALGPADVPGWGALAAAQAGTAFAAHLGTLGDALAAGGVCATAVGPGAAAALATSAGVVARYTDAPSDAAFTCPVTVVDAGVTSDLDGSDADVRAVDAVVADVLAAAPADAAIVIVSVALPVGGALGLGVAVATGPGFDDALLATPSTRWGGVVRLLDVPSTILEHAGVPEPPDVEGASFAVAGPRPAAAATVAHLAAVTTADQTLRRSSGSLGNLTSGLTLAVLVLVLLVSWPPRSSLQWLAASASAVVAALPIAAVLVAAFRWWYAASPFAAMWLGIAGLTVLLAAAALGAARLTRAHPALLLAGVGAVVLGVDVVLGSTLHRGSPLGPSPIFGGRYYGFGNSTYALFTVYVLVGAAGLAAYCVRSGRARLAPWVVAGVGLLAVLADVWPTWGADIGGGLALVPAFVVLGLAVARVRLTPARTVLALAAGVVVVALVAVLDWLRPADQRSHAGRFVQQVIDGDAWSLIARKASYAWRSLGSGLPAWLTLALVIFALLILWRPEHYAPPRVRDLLACPGARALLGAVFIALVFAGFVNDYGIRIATIGATAAIPLAALAAAYPRAG